MRRQCVRPLPGRAIHLRTDRVHVMQVPLGRVPLVHAHLVVHLDARVRRDRDLARPVRERPTDRDHVSHDQRLVLRGETLIQPQRVAAQPGRVRVPARHRRRHTTGLVALLHVHRVPHRDTVPDVPPADTSANVDDARRLIQRRHLLCADRLPGPRPVPVPHREQVRRPHNGSTSLVNEEHMPEHVQHTLNDLTQRLLREILVPGRPHRPSHFHVAPHAAVSGEHRVWLGGRRDPHRPVRQHAPRPARPVPASPRQAHLDHVGPVLRDAGVRPGLRRLRHQLRERRHRTRTATGGDLAERATVLVPRELPEVLEVPQRDPEVCHTVHVHGERVRVFRPHGLRLHERDVSSVAADALRPPPDHFRPVPRLPVVRGHGQVRRVPLVHRGERDLGDEPGLVERELYVLVREPARRVHVAH